IWMDGRFPWPYFQWAAAAIVVSLAGCYLLLVSRVGAALAQNLSGSPLAARLPAMLRTRWTTLWYTVAGLQDATAAEVLLVFACGFAGHFLETLQHLYIAQAVGLELSFWIFAWLRGVILICAIVPVSLSGLGLREASVVALLIFYGVPEEQAL